MPEKAFVSAAGKDWLLPFYDPLTRLLGVERIHRRIVDQAGIRAGSRVLDVGCGTGNLTILAKRLNPSTEIIGIDPDPRALARARRKAQQRGISARFETAYCEELPFADASFDRVLSALMLHHLKPEAKPLALREVRRVLRPGGSLHLADFEGGHARGGLHGIVASIAHARHRFSASSVVLDLMRDAGLADAQVVAHDATILGAVVHYTAVRPPEGRM